VSPRRLRWPGRRPGGWPGRRPLAERDPFRLGVAATVLVAVAVLLAVTIGRAGIGQARYTAEFAHAGELRAGDEVRVAGMPVGEVTGLRLAGDRVLVDLRVDRDVHLGSGTEASIKLSTLVGGRSLDLRPIGDDDLAGDRIPLAHTSVPYDLQKVLQTGTPLVEQLDPDKAREAMRAVSASLRDQGPKVGAALDGLSRLSDVVVTRRDQIAHLISSTEQVVTLVDQRSDRLFALLGQSDQLLAELNRRRDLIRGVLTDLAAFTTQLRKAVAENESQVGPLLDNAAELTAALRAQDDAVDRALELVAPAGRYLNNVIGNGPYGEVYAPYSIIPDSVLCQAKAVSGCR
jgi:phospholipid/cholesterol/gamma-HCH transport system substrate-binding protein